MALYIEKEIDTLKQRVAKIEKRLDALEGKTEEQNPEELPRKFPRLIGNGVYNVGIDGTATQPLYYFGGTFYYYRGAEPNQFEGAVDNDSVLCVYNRIGDL